MTKGFDFINKTAIICSSITFAAIFLLALSANAVEAPETLDVVETTMPTTTSCSATTTSRMTTSTTSCTTTTMLTTITEVSTEANTEVVIDDPEPIVKEERHEELWSEPVTEPIPVEEYVVYKPSSYYIHRNTCRWNKDDAYRIDNTEGIEARRCSECNPDMEIINEYVEPEPEYIYIPISDSDRYYLAVMVSHECSPRASVEHNANAVACMYNRVRDGWASSIYDAIQTSCVPWWGGGSLSSYGISGDASYCYDAIDYYLSHSDSYTWQHSWEASGDDVHNSYS